MAPSITQKIIAAALGAVAIALIAVGCFHSYKVYDRKDDAFAEFGVATFTRVRDWQLVEDATFTGVQAVKGALYSTYDRTVSRGKRACPT